MSDASSRLPEAEADANHTGAQDQADSLEQHLEVLDLNDQQGSMGAQEPRRHKLSARDLLEKLNSRRLEVTQINFTAGGTQAGKGRHGEVVVATLTLVDGTSSESASQIAVKKFLLSGGLDEEKFLRSFANELRILDELDHPNIIKLVGFVENMGEKIAWLVFPWEPNGNVREFLLSGKWELPERVSLIKDVVSGLEYLHSRQPPIRHGDLKSLNILVNSDHGAVITDFGSARIQTGARDSKTTGVSLPRQGPSADSELARYDESSELNVSSTNGGLTLTGPSWSFRWAAPEILNEEEPCLASDIWALGWIAWEVVTDNYPFPEAKTNKAITINIVMGRLPQLYDNGQLSQVGLLCYLMVKCWKPEPNKRPSAAECQNALQFIPSTIPSTKGDGISQIRSAVLLVEIGSMHQLHSRFKEALKFFDEAVAIARSAADKETMAYALRLSVYSHRMVCNYDKAEKAGNESLAIYTSIDHSHGRATALLSLGELQHTQSNSTKAEEYFTQALAVFASIGNSLGQANALRWLGIVYQEQSNYAEASDSLNQALEIFTSIEDSLGRANVLQGLGEIHQAQSNHGEAKDHFEQALAIYTSIGHRLGHANVLQRLGEIHAQFDSAKAEEYYNQALALYTTMGSTHGQANIIAKIGEIHQAQYSHAKAMTHFNQALALYVSIGEHLGQATVLWRLGETHQTLSNYSDAENFFNQALSIYTRLGNSPGQTNALLALGELLLRQTRYSDAKSFLHDAAEVSNRINYKWAQTRSKALLAEVLEAEKSPAEAAP